MPANYPTETLKVQFSGHETFPLRQLWLSKVAELIKNALDEAQAPTMNGEDAMIDLGVGKNMVSSMRFWADACGIVDAATLTFTPYGKLIFGESNTEEGLDECCESLSTQWFVHWRLASTPEKFTPIWYLFNLITAPTFDRDTFYANLMEFVRSSGRRVSDGTVRRGGEVALRSYAPRITSKATVEDFIEPLLGELDLVDAKGRDLFFFHRGAHPTLPDALFAFALLEYWERLTYQTSSLDFAKIAYDYGSPGKVFKLDTDALNHRLANLAEITGEALLWTEQAGLRQVVRRGEALDDPEGFKLKLLKKAYT